MKKFLILVLSILLTFSLTACGTKNNETENPSGNENNNAEKNNSGDESFDISTWGRTDIVSTDNGEVIDRYKINVPQYIGSYHMHSKISEHLDDTVVLISGQYIDTPAVDNVSGIFSDYIDYTIESLEALYGIKSSNFKMTIDSSKPVTIGDYEMYTHNGTISYDFDGTKRTRQYVAYATKLKDSGNCAYWMVYDDSKDQSKGDLIKEHAYNMARTFREEA